MLESGYGHAGKEKSDNVQTLVGMWKLAVDPDNKGREERWFDSDPVTGAQDAPVPGIIQQVFPDYHGVAWYWYRFEPVMSRSGGRRCLLKFGAVDYLADVWLNGISLGGHEDGETPFSFNVTDALKFDSENLLVVRVLNPTDEPIDGIKLQETPHCSKTVKGYQPGRGYNFGGIMLPVELVSVPEIRVTDIFARTNISTGQIRVSITVENDHAVPAGGSLVVSVSPAKAGEVLSSESVMAEFIAAEKTYQANLFVDRPRLWSLEDPYLYRVEVDLEAAAGDMVFTHKQWVNCGFRDFYVKNGYFYLNGKRIFLRSSHTGDHYPIGQKWPHTPDLLRQDLVYAKASGFNTVRFIAGVAIPEQLDFCDEIGLMVYEECYASWCLADSPKMGERYDRSVLGMVQRDRNHPSVTIWGLLNETEDGPVFRRAEACLKKLRQLDDTRLVLINSGRWDRQPSIGSVSNPGSWEWEHVWGVEAPDARPVSDKSPMGGYFDKAGDAHVYPVVPQTPEVNQFIRTLGKDSEPVFLSEYGIGSLLDVIHGSRMYEQVGARPDLSDAVLFRSMAEKLIADWEKFGMDGVYPFPAEMLRDSQRLHIRQRLLGFDLIRSNPNLCGYNVTGLLDHGITGEGLWNFWREFKPGIMDALADGWAPLRWCLFVEPMHGYLGRKIKVEVVLANEDVLRPGRYPARLRISDCKGIVWEKCMDVNIPEPPPGEEGPLAVPVFSEEVVLEGEAGAYQLAVSMERGGDPVGEPLTFYMSDPAALPGMQETVTTWGIDDRVQKWLGLHGITCRRFRRVAPDTKEVILVGDLANMQTGVDDWRNLLQRIQRGSTALFLSPLGFTRGEDAVGWLPLANKGRCYKFHDWLYHKECVAKLHPIFHGLQSKGIMDWDYYGQVIPHHLFDGQDVPDDVAAAAFATGYSCPGGYASGILFGTYSFGQGRFCLNTFRVLENVDIDPAADRLLLNMIDYARRTTSGSLAELPTDFDTVLRKVGIS